MKTIKLSADQAPILDQLLLAQAKQRDFAGKARPHEAAFKAARDQLLTLVGEQDLVIFVSPAGRQVKFERKTIHYRARPAGDSTRWDVAEFGAE